MILNQQKWHQMFLFKGTGHELGAAIAPKI
jgi:hypothetical protein